VISLNAAVLIMTLVVPYQTITFVISAINPVMITPSDKILFMKGLSTAYFWLAIVNVAAIVPSVLRGGSKHTPKVGDLGHKIFGYWTK